MPLERWDSEQVWNDGDGFFAALSAALATARTSLDLETYILADDHLGAEVTAALASAAARGVAVRLTVDGIGSLAWLRSQGPLTLAAGGIAVRTYHPTLLTGGMYNENRQGLGALLDIFSRLNRRNHRKVCIIDGTTAFVGSMNCTAEHFARLSGSAAWRDTGAQVTGRAVGELAAAFSITWRKARSVTPSRHRLHEPKPTVPPASGLVRLNTTRRQRRALWQDLSARIHAARVRVWLTTAYFVPRRRLLSALVTAAQQGCDVRLLVGERSDHPLMFLVAQAFLHLLRRRGVRILLYQPCILHAKNVLIDDWATVGSTNLNHRSALHDLEADVVLTSPAALATLEQGWARDSERARMLTDEDWRDLPVWKRLLGRLTLLVRHWL